MRRLLQCVRRRRSQPLAMSINLRRRCLFNNNNNNNNNFIISSLWRNNNNNFTFNSHRPRNSHI